VRGLADRQRPRHREQGQRLGCVPDRALPRGMGPKPKTRSRRESRRGREATGPCLDQAGQGEVPGEVHSPDRRTAETSQGSGVHPRPESRRSALLIPPAPGSRPGREAGKAHTSGPAITPRPASHLSPSPPRQPPPPRSGKPKNPAPPRHSPRCRRRSDRSHAPTPKPQSQPRTQKRPSPHTPPSETAKSPRQSPRAFAMVQVFWVSLDGHRTLKRGSRFSSCVQLWALSGRRRCGCAASKARTRRA
jgi:hypothetical protein